MQKFCEDGYEFHVGHTEFDLLKRNIDPYGDIRQAVGKQGEGGFFENHFIYLFIFGCAGSLLLLFPC